MIQMDRVKCLSFAATIFGVSSLPVTVPGAVGGEGLSNKASQKITSIMY